eukprot:520006-Alexandrium_andersonii.AAC.1
MAGQHEVPASSISRINSQRTVAASPRTCAQRRGGSASMRHLVAPLGALPRCRKARRMFLEQAPPRTADCMGERRGSRRGPRTAARVAPTRRRQQLRICRGRRAAGVSAPSALGIQTSRSKDRPKRQRHEGGAGQTPERAYCNWAARAATKELPAWYTS